MGAVESYFGRNLGVIPMVSNAFLDAVLHSTNLSWMTICCDTLFTVFTKIM